MIYVLACPRSATKATHALLRCGDPPSIDVGHESMGADGCVGFPWGGCHDFDLSFFVQRVRSDPEAKVIHLVREPLACISSLLTIRPFLDGMAPRIVPGLPWASSPATKAVSLWVHLNDTITSLNPQKMWRAEATPVVPDNIRDSHQGAPNYEPVTWARLWLEAPEWTGRAVLMAWEYGYDVSPHAFSNDKEALCTDTSPST